MSAESPSGPAARTAWRAIAVVSATMALVASLLGQDASWDWRNYHFYNAHALLHGRVGLDLAPAQMQSYFAPLLDLFHVTLLKALGGPGAAAVTGALQGLICVPLYRIAARVLQDAEQRERLLRWVTGLGLLTPVLLSEIGNWMGDTLTAIPVLFAVWLLLPRTATALRLRDTALAGALMGVAVGLKLTNAPFALAGLLATAWLRQGVRQRWAGGCAVYVLAAATTFMVSGGWWFLKIWTLYGNPFFPQFNALFHAPLAAAVNVADAQWHPRSWWEWLTWPVVFTLDPERIGTSPLPQAVWLLLYGLTLLAVARRWLGRRANSALPSDDAALAWSWLWRFFLLAFLLWMAVFSIHRYLLVLEVLIPLMVVRLWPGASTRRTLQVLVLGTAVAVVGWNTWGHAGWRTPLFGVEQPVVERDAAVLLVGDAPQAWRIAFLPQQAIYIGVAGNFPESDAYRSRVHTLAARAPARHAMIPAVIDAHRARAERMNAVLERTSLNRSAAACRMVGSLLARNRKRVVLESLDSDPVLRCRFVGRPQSTVKADQARLAESAAMLLRYGLFLQQEGCRLHGSRIGTDALPFWWCPVTMSAQAHQPRN